MHRQFCLPRKNIRNQIFTDIPTVIHNQFKWDDSKLDLMHYKFSYWLHKNLKISYSGTKTYEGCFRTVLWVLNQKNHTHNPQGFCVMSIVCYLLFF